MLTIKNMRTEFVCLQMFLLRGTHRQTCTGGALTHMSGVCTKFVLFFDTVIFFHETPVKQRFVKLSKAIPSEHRRATTTYDSSKQPQKCLQLPTRACQATTEGLTTTYDPSKRPQKGLPSEQATTEGLQLPTIRARARASDHRR
jgi:hypothetical protein